ncbi:hypothetical protein H2198_007847 [Neophaeococcomyces mojaviensis]|uniref:Uncharacterized protein n=1 Tax=Neophaeococcomyces mojaviensis TaxID=3383035 RepID=A0ACC2ZYU3_9EURO|nr:hypothetical protein H2198_007847 [Knufia sp. JES_112]
MTFCITAEHKFQLAQWAHGLPDFKLVVVRAQLACAFKHCKPDIDHEDLVRIFEARQDAVIQEIKNRGGVPFFDLLCAPWHKDKDEPHTWTLTDFSALPDSQTLEQTRTAENETIDEFEQDFTHPAPSPVLDMVATDDSWLDDAVFTTYPGFDLNETLNCNWLDDAPQMDHLPSSLETFTVPLVEMTKHRLDWETEHTHRMNECDWSQLPIISSYTEMLNEFSLVKKSISSPEPQPTTMSVQQARDRTNSESYRSVPIHKKAIRRTDTKKKQIQGKNARKPQKELTITEPLSVMNNGPVMDMMAWATRSNDERYKEVVKRKGKIPRPVNCFMMYRTAYSVRIKQWAAQGNNNQLISRVAGASWVLESDELKEFYTRCAEADKANHQAAFPDYKYDPKKRSHRKMKDHDNCSSELGDPEESEDEDQPPIRRSRRS